jgi:hypothetical protein
MKFADWFREQHGKRFVNDQLARRTDDELRQIVQGGIEAQRELDERRLWEARRTSALWAWSVNDADKQADT